MTENFRKKAEPIISWVLAMILCPLGVCFAAKSQFGVSMIEAPVFAIYNKISEFWKWYTVGTSEYFCQAIILIIMCIVVRKFKWKYMLSFVTAFIFGQIFDSWNYIFAFVTADTLAIRIIFAVFSCVIISFAVSMFFRTWLPLEVWELFVKEVVERYNLNMTKFKWIYDISSLFLGVILILIFFDKFRWDIVGIGTIITTFVNAPLIGGFSKLQDKLWDKITK